MKLSTKGRYGLRALVDLAQHCEKEPVSITSIAQRQDISEGYLEQLMALLKKGGFVRSVRGAGGGYIVAKKLEDISVGDVLRSLEGSLEPVECTGFQDQERCKSSENCVTKYVWQKLNESINQTADEIKLDQLLRESEKCSDQQEE